MRRSLLWLIRLYQVTLSPDHSTWGQAAYGPSCRYSPSCSEYARQAVERFGAARGLWLAAQRLGSCHPWSAGGHDPVPGVVRDP